MWFNRHYSVFLVKVANFITKAKFYISSVAFVERFDCSFVLFYAQ